ncbi:MAG: type 4a pilus biogenesis protein PilO [Planctomycetes bacterium]|nr:type 4a pilus biogenesis protein PilO [Planctomycetota bacterium]
MVKARWNRNWILTVAITVAVILGSGGLSYWIYDEYQKTKEEENDLQSQIETAKVKRDKVPGLESEVIKLRENVKEYVKILPDTKEVNEFVKKLSDFANQSGVELVSLKDDKRSGRKKTQEVFDKESFRLELTGNVFEFLKFISLIENYERFITISEISVKAGDYDEDILR